jgi:hypothetical protein
VCTLGNLQQSEETTYSNQMMDICQEELATLAPAFEERLDKMSLDVLGKAEDKAAKVTALLFATTLEFEGKAAVLLFDVAAKAREDGTACRSRR